MALTQDEIRVLKKLAAELLRGEKLEAERDSDFEIKALLTADYLSSSPPSRRRVVLSDAQIEEMRSKYEAGGTTIQDIAVEYGISTSYAWRVLKGKVRA